MAKSRTAEGHIDHGTVGRINVEHSDEGVTLRLWQHSLKPDATLSWEEASRLARRLDEVIERYHAQPRRRATAPVAPEEDDDPW